MLTNPRFEMYYDRYVELFRQSRVDRVFLCAANLMSSDEEKDISIERLVKYVPKLKAEGFEVGIWINSLGHGGTCGDFVNDDITDGLQRMVGLDGKMNMGAYCPLCENVQKTAADWVRRLGTTGADMLMMDDDYRYGFRNDILCACEKHRMVFEKELGEPFDAAKMKMALTAGGPNRRRDTWLRVQGESLNNFAAILRSALDETAQDMRFSICSVLSTWDTDGVDSITLAKTLAGNTRPFLRLIGAPYWAAIRSFHEIRLGAVCEYERLQQQWCRDEDIEIFCEGDTYPRPSYMVPAAYLEGFDQVMRAAGTSDGILKYMMDYSSSPDFEQRYLMEHDSDAALFDVLERKLAGKTAVGAYVFAPMKTFALSHFPGGNPDDRCIPAALRFVTDNSLPVRYDAGDDAAVIFGDAAELASEKQLAHGALLDITAAQILTRRGLDVGLGEIVGEVSPDEEHFLNEDEVVGITGGKWIQVKTADSAHTDSVLSGYGMDNCPAVYTYENDNGQRFAVYCFRAQESFETGAQHGVFRTGCRAIQARRLLTWLSGRHMDAVCDGAPDLYMMAKRSGDEMTVALWNFGVDAVLEPKVRLGDDWSTIECDWGVSELNDRCVTCEKLPAFGCICFTLKK